jgi:hypothetical protein
VQFLQGYLREHWAVLRHAQIRDPAFGLLTLIEKWGVGAPDARQVSANGERRTHAPLRMRSNP